ncbi:hypothetical protein [Azohydromonas aeria]|uniref:hypothetical protein n=1 Tax=Azohydromonas aeria TaxID=2590212 RepID=UPI0012F8DA4C|nr:hypothetical protein [Azohydromonas aeria]
MPTASPEYQHFASKVMQYGSTLPACSNKDVICSIRNIWLGGRTIDIPSPLIAEAAMSPRVVASIKMVVAFAAYAVFALLASYG